MSARGLADCLQWRAGSLEVGGLSPGSLEGFWRLLPGVFCGFWMIFVTRNGVFGGLWYNFWKFSRVSFGFLW